MKKRKSFMFRILQFSLRNQLNLINEIIYFFINRAIKIVYIIPFSFKKGKKKERAILLHPP